ncbi:MAG: transposase [Planctomycetota bacterium]|nr:transposase [Planctomycetota bacterium]
MQERRRNSMRWRGFNYAQPKAYYVTMCVTEKRCLLSRVVNDRVELTAIGGIVEEYWFKIPTVFRHVELDACVIMPNHVHAIIRFRPPERGARLADRPSLGDVIRWWKTQSSLRSGRALWQRGYYDRVIRDDDELFHARGYIHRNPVKWREDPDHPHAVAP